MQPGRLWRRLYQQGNNLLIFIFIYFFPPFGQLLIATVQLVFYKVNSIVNAQLSLYIGKIKEGRDGIEMGYGIRIGHTDFFRGLFFHYLAAPVI